MLKHLLEGEILSQSQAEAFFTQVIQGQVEPLHLAAALVAMKVRKEQPAEIAGAAAALRANAAPFNRPDYPCVDNCGTGGDGSQTFNISTTAAIVAAECGVKVAKHGNRSVSSRSGSADLLERLGYNLDMSADVARQCLDQTNMTFLMAPLYHSGIRHAMPVRKSLGVRTLFNLLGPLVNPATPDRQLMGIYDPALCQPIAKTLGLLGVKRAMVVNGSGMDEIALHGATQIAELNDGDIREYQISHDDFGCKPVTLAQIQGGSPEQNADITVALLQGKGTMAEQSIVAVNVATLLLLTEQVSSLKQGYQFAMDVMQSGKAEQRLTAIIKASNSGNAHDQ